MGTQRSLGRWGFSLLELVIVVAIVAILAAIGVPRMSRGSRGAGDSALGGDLTTLRSAIDLYATEHTGTYPAVDKIGAQLTQYSNAAGAVSDKKTTDCIYGPYVRAIPPLPVGAKRGKTGIAAVDGAEVGWIYDATEGTVHANTTDAEKDDTGKLYSTY